MRGHSLKKKPGTEKSPGLYAASVSLAVSVALMSESQRGPPDWQVALTPQGAVIPVWLATHG